MRQNIISFDQTPHRGPHPYCLCRKKLGLVQDRDGWQDKQGKNIVVVQRDMIT